MQKPAPDKKTVMEKAAPEKSADAFRTISEVAEELDLPQHVLRFWETRFPSIKPMKRAGGRRFYRRDDVDLLRAIRHLLYADGYTIKGVQRLLKERGVRSVMALPGQAILAEYSPQVLGPENDIPDMTDMSDEDEPSATPAAPVITHHHVDDAIDGFRPVDPRILAEPRFASGSAQPAHAQPVRGQAPMNSIEKAHNATGQSLPHLAGAGGHLSRDLEQKLQAALFELAECERILAAALQSAI